VQRDDQSLFDVRDVFAAIGLLTRIPVPVDGEVATRRGAYAAWAYPLAGVVVAIPVVLVALAFQGFGAGVAVGVALLTLVVMTGAMHEDGLADAADGLWGGWDKARRLEIMKDSRIGVYGVLALVLFVLVRWSALGTLLDNDAIWVWVGAIVAGRTAMVWVMTLLPNAREGGLSASVGRPRQAHGWAATGLALVVLVATVPGLVAASAVAILVACLAGLIARAKIGGQTGDILGATGVLVETTVLVAAVPFV